MENSDERVMQLLEGALLRPTLQREAWLRLECPNEPDLAREVLERAHWEDKLDGFLSDPIILRSRSREVTFATGARVALRYRIVREVGRGRASTVYEAFDSHAERRVALKIGGSQTVPPPHIALPAIYGHDQVETTDGVVRFSVMELLEGFTLADTLRKSHPPADARATIAHQLCLALIHTRTAGLSPAALSANGIILTARGPVLTEDWRTAPEPQAECADVAAFGLILRRLLPSHPVTGKTWSNLRAMERDLRKANGLKRLWCAITQ